jgi:hypothetical protein
MNTECWHAYPVIVAFGQTFWGPCKFCTALAPKDFQ